jgi:hypothetical protein
VIASTAVTTGIFVLAGVLVGGLVTGAVNYVLERRREQASAQVALRLLESELTHAGNAVETAIERSFWAPWNFARTHRTWDEHRAEAARVLSDGEWQAVARGFRGIDALERGFGDWKIGEEIRPDGLILLRQIRKTSYEGANALRQRMGMDLIPPDRIEQEA